MCSKSSGGSISEIKCSVTIGNKKELITFSKDIHINELAQRVFIFGITQKLAELIQQTKVLNAGTIFFEQEGLFNYYRAGYRRDNWDESERSRETSDS